MKPRRVPPRSTRSTRPPRSIQAVRSNRRSQPGFRITDYLRPIILGGLAGVALFLWFFPWKSGPQTPNQALSGQAPTLESLQIQPVTTRKVVLPGPAPVAAEKPVAPPRQPPKRPEPVTPPATVAAPEPHPGKTLVALPVNPVPGGRAAPAVPGAASRSGPEQPATPEEPAPPPLPSELAPRVRTPDVDLTFYRELPNRKVTLPPETVEPKPGNAAAAAPLPPRSLLPEQTEPTQLVKPDWFKPKEPTNPAGNWNANTDRGVFEVQVGVFSELDRATGLVDRLRGLGAAPRVVSAQSGGSNLHRVRLGPFGTREEAAQAMQRWKVMGQPALILDNTPRPALPPVLRPGPLTE